MDRYITEITFLCNVDEDVARGIEVDIAHDRHRPDLRDAEVGSGLPNRNVVLSGTCSENTRYRERRNRACAGYVTAYVDIADAGKT
ncbi:MAG: hypothetical protein ABIR80_02795, partial [Opitutaceae bacterium]